MLDIIIPVYNNQEGLEKTLASINPKILDKITITIIDDCSNIPCKSNYNIIRLEQNSGPGAARNKGIDSTHEKWILFIDAGDTFVDFETQILIIQELEKSTAYMIWYKFNSINKNNHIVVEDHINNMLHGNIYLREFLNNFHINFCTGKSGGYICEDIGFNMLCRLAIMNHSLENKFIKHDIPLINYYYDSNSLTNKNKSEYRYKTQILGLTENVLHIINIATKNNFLPEVIIGVIYTCFGRIYYDLLWIINFYPLYAQKAWEECKTYYKLCYFPYREIQSNNIKTWINQHLIQLLTESYDWPHSININFKKFLLDLERKEYLPDEYLQ